MFQLKGRGFYILFQMSRGHQDDNDDTHMKAGTPGVTNADVYEDLMIDVTMTMLTTCKGPPGRQPSSLRGLNSSAGCC